MSFLFLIAQIAMKIKALTFRPPCREPLAKNKLTSSGFPVVSGSKSSIQEKTWLMKALKHQE